jgi:polyisoprenoid-binding protein YceI
MKKVSILALFMVIAPFSFLNSQTLVYAVDTGNSSINWKGNRSIGGGHEGTINISEGSLIFENGVISGGSFIIDMNTINTTDLTEGRKERLDGHLKNEDFFDVTKFPVSKLVITKVEAVSTGRYRITGDLTIKGKTMSVQFPATVGEVGGKIVASGAFSFNRTDFDVRYGSGKFFDNLGDRAIEDDVPLTINVVADKQ